jgi:hypothetical protein
VDEFPLPISFHHGSPCSYISRGWTLGPLVVAVQRRGLTPSTRTSTRYQRCTLWREYTDIPKAFFSQQRVGRFALQRSEVSAASRSFSTVVNTCHQDCHPSRFCLASEHRSVRTVKCPYFIPCCVLWEIHVSR